MFNEKQKGLRVFMGFYLVLIRFVRDFCRVSCGLWYERPYDLHLFGYLISAGYYLNKQNRVRGGGPCRIVYRDDTGKGTYSHHP